MDGQPIYGGNSYWQPRAEAQYPAYYPPAVDQGYRVDKDGARIIHEDPLPPNAQAIN